MQRFNRAHIVDSNFVRVLGEWSDQIQTIVDRSLPVRDGHPLTGDDLLELFESQMVSRHLDLAAREMRPDSRSFYTIASSGHEGNAVVGRVTRHTDPAFLHYRSGALMAERARKLPDQDVIRDTLLSLSASVDDPIAGGRHKVWGSRPLWVLPQTSTIASHLPKSVGVAMAIARAKRLKLSLPIPDDSIAVCSFGDASTHHATAQTAINAACYTGYSRLPLPILFVAEDNGLGISLRTATGWVETNFAHRPGLKYYAADGLDVVAAHAVARQAVDECRHHRVPVFLHLRVVRLLGHAGTDFELEYRSIDQIEATEAKDPLLATARIAIEAGLVTPGQALEQYEEIRARVRAAAEQIGVSTKLATSEEIIRPLAPFHPKKIQHDLQHASSADSVNGPAKDAPSVQEMDDPPRHLAVQINRALGDLMAAQDDIVLFGEDVAQKGGVYYVTRGLHKRFGAARVFNTLLDETMILGLAQGFGTMGMLPIAEIQYLAYVHNAADQIRGEACSLQFFSNDQFRNPMVVRIASFGYQKGFGGHFHNDSSTAALRDIPGLVIAVPSRGDDAVQMLRTAVSMARVDGRIVAFLEPIALYMTKDLHEDGDGGWLTQYPREGVMIAPGEQRVYHEEARDAVIITYGNGVYLSLRAARSLAHEQGLRTRVVDLRWLNPLNEDEICRHARECEAVVVVDEGRRAGGVAEAVMTAVVEGCHPVPRMERVTGADTYIPLGPAANLVLPTKERIVAAVASLRK